VISPTGTAPFAKAQNEKEFGSGAMHEIRKKSGDSETIPPEWLFRTDAAEFLTFGGRFILYARHGNPRRNMGCQYEFDPGPSTTRAKAQPFTWYKNQTHEERREIS
jgi:hypothetical protein